MRQKMLSGSDDEMYHAMFQFANGLDDLHTSYMMEGFNGPAGTNANSRLTLDDLSPRVQVIINHILH